MVAKLRIGATATTSATGHRGWANDTLLSRAGASLAAGLPSTQEIGEHLIVMSETTSSLFGEDLDTIAQTLYDQAGYGRGWVQQQIIDLLRAGQRRLSSEGSYAHQEIACHRWQALFTSNFDLVAEMTYSQSPDRVQDLNPFFAPDRQVYRSDPDTVRYVKLNGSIDEAARNADHHLVLTFADQEDARVANHIFYDFLGQVAVNGPIVFVGFSFTHPGAVRKTTSPEFFLLRSLLSEMGTSGNWHYCVFPQGESAADKAFVEQLKRIRCPTTGWNFRGIHRESRRRRLDGGSSKGPWNHACPSLGPLDRDLNAYKLNSLRPVFEVLTMAHEENSPPPIEQTLRGQAEWSAFFNGQLLYRDAQETLESKLAAREHREADLHVVVAPVAWGKTYLLKQLVADRARRGDPTVWLNPTSVVDLPRPDGSTHSLGTWDFKAIRRVVRALTDTALAPRVLLIADDVPERISEVLAVLDYLRVENLHADIVFALRDTDSESAHADYPAVQSAHVTDLTLPTDPAAELERLLDLCAREGIGTLNDVPTRDLVRERIITERAHLLPLLALVMIFDKDHRRFEEIIGSLWAELASIELQDVLIRISVLHRYGNRYAPRLYPLIRSYPDNEREEVQNAVRRLLSKGLLRLSGQTWTSQFCQLCTRFLPLNFVKALR